MGNRKLVTCDVCGNVCAEYFPVKKSWKKLFSKNNEELKIIIPYYIGSLYKEIKYTEKTGYKQGKNKIEVKEEIIKENIHKDNLIICLHCIQKARTFKQFNQNLGKENK